MGEDDLFEMVTDRSDDGISVKSCWNFLCLQKPRKVLVSGILIPLFAEKAGPFQLIAYERVSLSFLR